MGKKRGHLHSLNKQGPLSLWMNSEWRHHEQRLARLASRSIQRITERLGFVMALPVGRVCHLDIGSLGSPLSRSKDLSCLVIRADTRQVDRVGCCPNADDREGRAREDHLLLMSDPSRLHHRGDLRRGDRGSDPLSRSRPQARCGARLPRAGADRGEPPGWARQWLPWPCRTIECHPASYVVRLRNGRSVD